MVHNNEFSGAQKDYSSEQFKGVVFKADRLVSKDFEDCLFVKCAFQESTFEYCKFRDCIFRDCDLSLVHFKKCTFASAKFEGSQLIGIDWTETAWPKTSLREPVSFTSCALNHSVFMGLSLKALTMTRCTARDVDFSDCDLTRADCRFTDFSESRFVNTNLTEADFTGATNYTIAAHLNRLKKTKFSLPDALSLLYSLDIVLIEP